MLRKHLFTLNKKNYTTVSLPINVNSDESTVSLKLTITTKEIEFLLDNGSSASLINSKYVKNGTKINKNNIIELEVATGHLFKTLAATTGSFIAKECEIQHEFHMFGSDMLHIKFDGLLGHDFFNKYKCGIDLLNETLNMHIFSSERSILNNTVSPNEPVHVLYLVKKPFYLQNNYIKKNRHLFL